MGGTVTFVVCDLVNGGMTGKWVAAIVCCGTILLCSCIEGEMFDVNSAVAVTVGMFAIPVTGTIVGIVVVTGKTSGHCTGIVTVTVFVGADTVTTVGLFT